MQEGSLLLTNNAQGTPGIHLIDLGKTKGQINLAVIQWLNKSVC